MRNGRALPSSRSRRGIIELSFLTLLVFGLPGCGSRTGGGGSPGSIANGGFTAFSKTFGGDGDEVASAMTQSSSSDFFVMGSTTSFTDDSTNVWAIKTTEQGDRVWARTIAATRFDLARITGITPTDTGGAVVVGNRLIPAGAGLDDGDVVVTELDSDGEIIWQHTFAGPEYREAHAIIRTNDGRYVLTGRTEFDLWVAGLESDGTLAFDRMYGLGRGDAIAECASGGFVVGGGSREVVGTPYRAVVVRIAADLTESWRYDGPEAEPGPIGVVVHSLVSFIEERPSGSIVATGTRDAGAFGPEHCFFARLEADGDEDDMATVDTPDFIHYRFLRPTPDGGYIATGHIEDGFSGYRKLVHKVTDTFFLEWERSFAYAQSRTGDFISFGPGTGYTIVGHAAGFNDATVTQLAADGSTLDQMAYRFENGGTSNDDAQIHDGFVTPDGAYWFVGETAYRAPDGETGGWIRRTNPGLITARWEVLPETGRDDRVVAVAATPDDDSCVFAVNVHRD
ncbi:MAG: hypothetical protein KDC38_11050, partial [Planctomycetes bacterium]|nr:hypothetical protein [Planctomycetota bacterium]